MAGSLIKIDEEIVTSAVASVTLGGSNWDSSYDVYMVRVNNVIGDTDNQGVRLRLLVSSSPDTSANYDVAYKRLRSDTTFSNISAVNETSITLGATGTAGNESLNGIYYFFNMNNASEYSFATMEASNKEATGILIGNTGGFVNTVAQSCNGIHFYMSSGNIDSGTFTLYGLKK